MITNFISVITNLYQSMITIYMSLYIIIISLMITIYMSLMIINLNQSFMITNLYESTLYQISK